MRSAIGGRNWCKDLTFATKHEIEDLKNSTTKILRIVLFFFSKQMYTVKDASHYKLCVDYTSVEQSFMKGFASKSSQYKNFLHNKFIMHDSQKTFTFKNGHNNMDTDLFMDEM